MAQNFMPTGGKILIKKAVFALLALSMGLNTAWLAAESVSPETGFYNPNYLYSGPQNQTIGDEEVEGKDPILATVYSILPGLVIHGFGNYYAEDYEYGTRMLVMEILGGGLALWGHHIIHNNETWGHYFGGSTTDAGYWIKAAGVGMIILSWIGDVTTAGAAAENYNHEHQIRFQLETLRDGTPALALTSRF